MYLEGCSRHAGAKAGVEVCQCVSKHHIVLWHVDVLIKAPHSALRPKVVKGWTNGFCVFDCLYCTAIMALTTVKLQWLCTGSIKRTDRLQFQAQLSFRLLLLLAAACCMRRLRAFIQADSGLRLIN